MYFHKKVKKIPLYKGELIIVLTNDKKKVKKYFNGFGNHEIYAHSLLTSYKGREGFVVVLNFHNENCKLTHGALAHEALHIANYIADARGISTGFDNDEAIAYLIEYATNQIYKFMKKHGMEAV